MVAPRIRRFACYTLILGALIILPWYNPWDQQHTREEFDAAVARSSKSKPQVVLKEPPPLHLGDPLPPPPLALPVDDLPSPSQLPAHNDVGVVEEPPSIGYNLPPPAKKPIGGSGSKEPLTAGEKQTVSVPTAILTEDDAEPDEASFIEPMHDEAHDEPPLSYAQTPPEPVSDEHIPSPDKSTHSESSHSADGVASPTATLKQKLQDVEDLLLSNNQGLQPPAGYNRKVLFDLTTCMYDVELTRSAVIILVSDSFHKSTLAGDTGRNRKRSILNAFKTLNVSYVFSPKDIEWAQKVYSVFPNEVQAVLFDRDDAKACFEDTGSGGCVRSPSNLEGIPAWKIFTWSDTDLNEPASPLGFPWTWTQERFYRGEVFVGWGIPETCRETLPFVGHAKRLDRAYILATLETYFWRTHNVWPPEYFEQIAGVGFATSMHPTEGRLVNYPEVKGIKAVPDNLVDLGPLSDKQTLEHISKSRLLLGLFDPRDMDVVHDALCMGVPFLNPIRKWDQKDPSNRHSWITQNMELNFLDPPYVYNVFEHDTEGFKKAVLDAVSHPIDRYITKYLTQTALEKRIAAILDRDWKTEAEQVLRRTKLPEILL